MPEPSALPCRDEAWQTSEAYLFGIDLFNAGYFWESHEAWEALWHALERRGHEAELLKALIQTSAARIKAIQGRPRGVRILSERSRSAIARLREAHGRRLLGLDLDRLLVDHREYFESRLADAHRTAQPDGFWLTPGDESPRP